MRIHVDTELCSGNTICVAVAPDLLDVREDEKAHVILEGEIGPEHRSQVYQAISMCPMRAISVSDG